MRSHTFESAIERIGRILARQYNIEVIFEGDQAYTDGKRIVLPFFRELTDELRLDLNGYLDHEVAHCKFTEFQVVKKVINRFHQEILNAVEDVRIEREMIKEFPGTAGHLNPLRKKWQAKTTPKMHELPWPVRLMLAVQYEMNGEPVSIDPEIKKMWNDIAPERAKLNSCESTKELLKVTEDITKKVMKEVEDQKKKESKEKSKDKKKGEKSKSKSKADKSEDQSEGEGDQSEDQSEGDQSEGDQSGKGEPCDQGEAEMVSENVGEAGSEWDNHCTDVHKLINQEIKEFIDKREETDPKKVKKAHDYTMGRGKHTPLSTRYDTVEHHKGNPTAYNNIKRSLGGLVSPIRRHLERALKVEENARWRMDRERGSINPRSLSSLATSPGFRTPFKDFTKVETNNVAVELLVDMSGSMMSQMHTAKKAVIAMAEALQSLNIPFEVTGFHAVYDRRLDGISSARGRFNRRSEKLSHHVFKSFTESKLYGIEALHVGHNNVDGESVRWAAGRLAEQKQNRKILMVFSDGMPAAEGNSHILNSDLKKAIQDIKRSGIECIGFGIETEDVKKFYPEYVVVNDVRDLPTKVMRKVSDLILRGLRR